MSFVEAGGHRLEYEWVGLGAVGAPVIVLLHQGLGSLSLWRDFPKAVHDATGLRVLLYSRWGYGKSDPVTSFPHGGDWMHRGAEVELSGLLTALGVERPILLGHSDGGSIALLYAARHVAPAALGVVAIAPHVMLEKESIVSLAKARVAYEEGDLKAKLGRFHDHVDSAFYGWNVTWLMPGLRQWSIEAELAGIACPLIVIQGEGDEYGTPAQLESIKRHTGGKAEIVLLRDCGHSPHIEQRAAVLGAVKRLVAQIEVPA
ncbi:MAG: alpha/beta hydrolase [Rhodospirillaceae bacterium]|nr:alpha/beta hydrolase [Rhodospirillaceae bacterium]